MSITLIYFLTGEGGACQRGRGAGTTQTKQRLCDRNGFKLAQECNIHPAAVRCDMVLHQSCLHIFDGQVASVQKTLIYSAHVYSARVSGQVSLGRRYC